MARYRLRFVLQEFDLPRGVTLIGRSVDCQLTIEDPLVSRKHARIAVSDSGAHIEDLGSRNGVRVNGTPIRQATLLRSGDRVRIGTQDLVFSRVDETGRAHARTTGQLRLCANCRQPYPREMLACPSCEATEQMDDETLTASGSGNSHQWTMQLFVEALERALRLGRVDDAERLLRRATLQIDELVASGGTIEDGALGALAVQAAVTTSATGDPAWAVWALEIYGRCGRIPSMRVVERLRDITEMHPAVREAISVLAARLSSLTAHASRAELDVLTRLAELSQEPGMGSVAPPDWR